VPEDGKGVGYETSRVIKKSDDEQSLKEEYYVSESYFRFRCLNYSEFVPSKKCVNYSTAMSLLFVYLTTL
jgi:hypothetical protein